MPEPFICTNNSFGNIDYGIPIVANKASDYRTSTGLYHRLIPNVAQEFDCRVKARIKPELKTTNVAIRDENNKSTYSNGYNWKFPQKDSADHFPKALRSIKINYVRDVQETIFKQPPPVKPLKISEMKDSFYRRYVHACNEEALPPEPYAKCEIRAFGRDEQPAIRPEENGYYKWMDPYLTTVRATYIPFTINQQNGVARKDIVTFYDASNVPKAKGFGPRNESAVVPLVKKRKIPMQDKMPFKFHPSDRRIRVLPKAVPHQGKTSEMKSNYVHQSFSVMTPYLFQSGIEFPDSLPKSSAWQNLPAPGMYCTEYCHIGSGWPVNSIIDYGLSKEYLPHKQCFTKFCDWSQ